MPGLPARPDFDHLRKQAKDFLRALKRGDAQALQRLKARHPDYARIPAIKIASAEVVLADAQRVLALEHGFASWAELKNHIRASGFEVGDAAPAPSKSRYKTPVDQYVFYRQKGFVVFRSLLDLDDVERFRQHASDILEGRVPLPGLPTPDSGATAQERCKHFNRIHMLHRFDALSEEYLLHPRILDVLEALIGPDILALQTMLFYNPPGHGGQGWHQDSFYLPTQPDTLVGCWLALDAADVENGCLWVVPGSHYEPVYPDMERGEVGRAFADLGTVEHVSSPDDSVNTLSRIAKKYPEVIPLPVGPGDAIFFDSHLLHRSYPNRTTDRWRRSFVSHYCSARSLVPWNHGKPFEGDSANYLHILARGSTHLPFAEPRFGSAKAKISEKASSGPEDERVHTGSEADFGG